MISFCITCSASGMSRARYSVLPEREFEDDYDNVDHTEVAGDFLQEIFLPAV